LTDLIFFGILNILGSGAANLVGNSVVAAGSTLPLQIGGAVTLLLGSSYTYGTAINKYKTNDAENKLIGDEMGSGGKTISAIIIVFFNLISTAVSLIFISRLLFPNMNSAFAIMFAIQLAILLIAIGTFGIEVNKTIINSVGTLCIGIIGLMGIAGIFHWFSGGHMQNLTTAVGSSFDPARAFLYIFFILAGVDVLVKFTEETVDEQNVEKGFYISTIIAALLLGGLCFAYIMYVPLRGVRHVDNVFAQITKHIFGDSKASGDTEASIMTYIAAAFILTSSLVSFIGTSRYIYSNIKETSFEGWRSLNSTGAPWKILLGAGGALIGLIYINNIDKLVAAADLFLVGTLAAVSWSAARAKLREGGRPWIESLTTLGLFGVGGLSIKQLFKRPSHHPSFAIAE
jgi:amino acid transporter